MPEAATWEPVPESQLPPVQYSHGVLMSRNLSSGAHMYTVITPVVHIDIISLSTAL